MSRVPPELSSRCRPITIEGVAQLVLTFEGELLGREALAREHGDATCCVRRHRSLRMYAVPSAAGAPSLCRELRMDSTIMTAMVSR